MSALANLYTKRNRRPAPDRTVDLFAAGLVPEELTLLGEQQPAGETFAERLDRLERERIERAKQHHLC